MAGKYGTNMAQTANKKALAFCASRIVGDILAGAC